MKDEAKDMIKNFNDRLTNPLVISFLISWIVINFKLILIIFSDYRVDVKISYLEESITIGNSLLYPALGCVIYLLVNALRIPYHWVYAKLNQLVADQEYKAYNSAEFSKLIRKTAFQEDAIKSILKQLINQNEDIKTLVVALLKYKNEIFTLNVENGGSAQVKVNDDASAIASTDKNELIACINSLEKMELIIPVKKNVFQLSSEDSALYLFNLISGKRHFSSI